jgi:hypothetical protein
VMDCSARTTSRYPFVTPGPGAMSGPA